MPSLKAWEQGSGVPAHRQVVQGPLGHCVRDGFHAIVSYLIHAEVQLLEGRQGPLGHSAREGLHPDVTDLIVLQAEVLELWERPAGIICRRLDCLSKGGEACIADAVTVKVQPSQLRQGPAGKKASIKQA